jgi:hypothetical protein
MAVPSMALRRTSLVYVIDEMPAGLEVMVGPGLWVVTWQQRWTRAHY